MIRVYPAEFNHRGIGFSPCPPAESVGFRLVLGDHENDRRDDQGQEQYLGKGGAQAPVTEAEVVENLIDETHAEK